MTEIWKDVVGYEGLYQVSNLGRVKSCKRIVAHPNNKNTPYQLYPERIMKQKQNRYGYMCIKLSKDSVRKDVMVHRLVAQAFIENTENKPFIDHLDGNKANNCVNNLEWVTMAENNQRAYDTGLKRKRHAGQFVKGITGSLQYKIRSTNDD